MKKLSPIKFKRQHERVVSRKIEGFFNSVFFDYLLAVLENKIENEDNPIIAALKSGKISYKDNIFIGKFSNRISLALEKLGAVYKRSGYYLEISQMPRDILETIAQVNFVKSEKIKKINDYLTSLKETLDFVNDNLEFYDEIKTIGEDLEGQTNESLKKVAVIPYEINEEQKKQIDENYINNLNKYISKWTNREVYSLREGISKIVMEGASLKTVEEYILSQKEVGKRKAKFLARQETRMFVSEYQKLKMMKSGVEKYEWSTVLDGRERSLHRKHNGKIYRFDNPPIIDERTGERGSPGETYNCRCVAIPVIDDDFLTV